MRDSLRNKIIVLLISIILTGILILIYFLDKSFEWGGEKIGSCILISLWIFFVVPAFRHSFLMNKDKSAEEWARIGARFGVTKIALPLLFAPFYGAKYYCTK